MGDERLFAYCGLYSGDCAGYSGATADLAGDPTGVLARYKFHLTAKCLFPDQISDYDACYKTLVFMAEPRCPTVCRERADDEGNCHIRACCIPRGIHARHECTDLEVCPKLKGHEALHGDACVRNLEAIREVGLEDWITSGERL